MKKEKTVEVLNSLVTINNDRIEGYQTASDATEETELKNLFSQMVSTSKQCREDLATEVKLMGGKTAEGTKTTGKFFRKWMDVKAALTGKDRKAILNSCEFGEDKAKDTYDNVLDNDVKHLSPEQKSMVNAQRSLLKVDREHIDTLNNALKEI